MFYKPVGSTASKAPLNSGDPAEIIVGTRASSSTGKSKTDQKGPWDSKLVPHEPLIFDLRRRARPMSYRKIKELLLTRFALTTSHSNIASFVKVRSKKPRKLIAMLPPSSMPATPDPLVTPAVSDASAEAWAKIAALKNKPVTLAKNTFHPDLSQPLTII